MKESSLSVIVIVIGLVLACGSTGCGGGEIDMGDFAVAFADLDIGAPEGDAPDSREQSIELADRAVVAMSTNGFTIGISNLQALRRVTGLSPRQRLEIQEVLGQLRRRLPELAEQGDPEAELGLELLKAPRFR